jgi:plasmid stabilization system protein ParE
MRLLYTELARNDLRTLRDYIARDNLQAAAETARYIRARLHDLAALPLTGRSGRLPGTRELFMRRYPYVAVYEVDNARFQLQGHVNPTAYRIRMSNSALASFRSGVSKPSVNQS